MSFGKKILEKYGYKDGEGLGKQKTGIVEPIKANFKFDQSGLGDKGPVKEDHWWERVYNEASTNINVNKAQNGDIGIDLTDKDGVEITNKSYSLKKLAKSNTTLQYGNFLKSATLLANKGEEKEIEGHITTNDIKIKPFQVLSDDELLKACNFRTAHKGARHGLNLNGKLQRIAEQEKALLEKLKTNRSEVFKLPEINVKQARKRPLIELNSSKDDSSDDEKLPINLELNERRVSKTRKKKDKKQVNVLVDIMESIELNKSQSKEQLAEPVHQDTPIKKKKKDKSKKLKADDLSKIAEEIEQIDEERGKRKKKRKAKKCSILDDDEAMTEKSQESCDKSPVKAKRVKLADSCDESNNSDEDIDAINEQHHTNMLLKKLASAQDPKSSNIVGSLRKNKKLKKKDKVKQPQVTDDSWNMKTQKKMEKYEYKKLKYKLKQDKLSQTVKNVSKKARKRLRKERKKELAQLTDKVASEINAVEL